MIFFDFHENDLPSVACIYLIYNQKTDRFYVGSTLNFKSRVMAHRSCLRRGKHHSERLQRSFDKHGEDCFRFVIASFCDPLCVRSLESIWLSSAKEIYNTNQNAAGGSDRGPVFWSSKEKTIEFANTKQAALFFYGNGNELNARKVQKAIRYCRAVLGGFFSRETMSFADLQSRRLIEKSKNKKRGPKPSLKKVYLYTEDSTLIKSYSSLREAAKELGVSVSAVSNAVNSTAYSRSVKGKYLSYHSSYFVKRADQSAKKTRTIYAYTTTGTFLRTFESSEEASRLMGVARSSVLSVCGENEKRKTCGGVVLTYSNRFPGLPRHRKVGSAKGFQWEYEAT